MSDHSEAGKIRAELAGRQVTVSLSWEAAQHLDRYWLYPNEGPDPSCPDGENCDLCNEIRQAFSTLWSGAMGEPKRIGTRRELADSNIRRFSRSLVRATRFGGKGNPAIIRDKLNHWLEYRHRAQKDGTLDDEVEL